MLNETFEIGDVISQRYKLVQEIGRGGFGVVYRATQLGMERDVAIKILHVNGGIDPTARERFRREALVVRNLNHPNTIRQYDFGETENGTLFLVLEFLQGLNLVQMIRRDGALGDERTKALSIGVLKSLAEAHSQGIIHRDLKPGNIMLCDVYGEQDYPKVLDFGIAKVMMGDSPDLTAAGIALGSPRYMAPEILRGEDPTPGADVYSVAISFAEAIIGQPLFKSEGSLDAAKIQLAPEPLQVPDELKLSALWPWLSIGLKKDLTQRFQSAEEMLRYLDADVEKLIERGADIVPSIAPTNILPAVEPITNDLHSGRMTMMGNPTSVADDDTNILTAEAAQKAIDDIRRAEVEKNTTQEQAIVPEPRETIIAPPHSEAEEVDPESRPTTVYEAVGNVPPPSFQQNQPAFGAEATDLHSSQQISQPPQQEIPAPQKIEAPRPVQQPKSSIFDEAPPVQNQAHSKLGPMTIHSPVPEAIAPKEKNNTAKIVFIMLGLFGLGLALLVIVVAVFLMFAKKDAPKIEPISTPTIEEKEDPKTGEDKDEKKQVVKLLTFDLSSSPSGATLYVNGKKRGTTPLTFSQESKLPIKILLKKKGYEPYEASLDGTATKINAALLPVFKTK